MAGVLGICALGVSAQRVMLKTNALYWCTASPNLGFEVRLTRHATLNVEAVGNYLPLSSFSTKFAALTPEARWWFEGRPQAKHFVGVMALGSSYKLKFSDTNRVGDAYGFGPTYGYSLVLGRHWSLEGTVGVGLLYYHQKKYKEGENDPVHFTEKKWTVAPLKVGVTLVYVLK